MRRSAALFFMLLVPPVLPAFAANPRPDRLAVDSGTWNLLLPSGPVPSPRQAGAVAYDPDGEQMILFGGEALNDTWSLSLAGTPSWSQLVTAHSPTARSNALMVYDSRRNRMILFGGNQGAFFVNDVWALNLDGIPDWTHLDTPGNVPPAQMTTAGIYDPVRDRLLIYSGYPPGNTGTVAWALDFTGTPVWEQLAPAGTPPSARWGALAGYDEDQDRFIFASGTVSNDPGGATDVWALSLPDPPQWTQLSPVGARPPSRFIASLVSDRLRRRFLMFGGYGTSPGPLNDTWDLELEGSATWVQLAPLGAPPSPRRNHMAVFDERNSRMIVFGGLTDVAGVVNDLWSLQLPPPGPVLPEVDSFDPAGGPAGTVVTIHGHHLDGVTQVTFNGVPAAILSSALPLQVEVQVPDGATTGPIRCASPAGFSESSTSYFVGFPPVLVSAKPDSGGPRAQVLLTGRNLVGSTRVSFGGVYASLFTVLSDSTIQATVGANASSGHITVVNPAGAYVSELVFYVLPADPHPRLLAVRDVPNDQGGRVSLRWEASDFDEPSTGTITGYRVWRRAPASLEVSALDRAPAGNARVVASRGNPADATDFWEPIADLPSAFLDGYAYTATTPYDSTADANPFTAFFIQALTADRATFYSSNVDSGYSVDNLAPPEPTPFAASYSSSSVSLHWRASRAADFREFRLYRGAGPGFPIVPQNLILTTQDTAYVDFSSGLNNFSYKLVAADVHGNASRAAMVSPEAPVATLASLLSADADATRIRLEWYSGDPRGATATVYRRQADTDWESLAEIVADGTGVLRYEDRAILPGQRYGYRLGIVDGGAQVFAGEVWMTAESPRLSMTAIWPNPATGGRFSVAFDLPTSEAASVELWDVAGRRIDRREVGGLGSGHHQVEFGGDARLAPGVYLVRLSSAGRKFTARVVLLN